MSPRALKVFTWQHMRRMDGRMQPSVELIALESKAALGRLVGRRPESLFNLREASRDADIEVKLSDPGVLFYRHDLPGNDDWARDENDAKGLA